MEQAEALIKRKRRTVEHHMRMYTPSQLNSVNVNRHEGELKEIRFIDAVSNGLEHAMNKHNDLIIMGQDIAEYGGVFKITEGFTKQFGKERL